MLDVKRLVLLRDLAELGTVTAVAEQHRVTPSAVSQQLRALEAEAGAALLHREGRTVRLTAAGDVLARECEHVLAALERAGSSLRALDSEVSGDVVIGCFPSGLEPIAAPLAAALAGEFPTLRPHVVEVEPEVAVARLRNRDLDLALTYRYRHLGTAYGPGVQAVPLFDEPLAVAVPHATLPLVERDGLRSLRHEPWIVTPAPSGCRDVLMHACQSAGFTPEVRHSYWDLRAALHLVAAGLGVTILPSLMCRNLPSGVAVHPLSGYGRSVEIAIRTGTDGQPAVRATIETAHRIAARVRAVRQAGPPCESTEMSV